MMTGPRIFFAPPAIAFDNPVHLARKRSIIPKEGPSTVENKLEGGLLLSIDANLAFSRWG